MTKQTSRREYVLPIKPWNSTVIGYSCRTSKGRRLWDTFDWKYLKLNSGFHWLDKNIGKYLNVYSVVVLKPEYPELSRRTYRNRVRVCCIYEVDHPNKRPETFMVFRGGEVVDVRVAKKRGLGWCWLVTVERSGK